MSLDLAAQREARRRKIQQNAKARMNKVLGQPDNAETNETLSTERPVQTTNQFPEAGEEDVNQPSPQPKEYNLRRRSQRNQSQTDSYMAVSNIAQSPESLLTDMGSIVGDNVSSQSAMPCRETDQTQDVTSTVYEKLERDCTQQARATHNQSNNTRDTTQSLDTKSIEILRMVACIVTAFLARYTLNLGFGLLMVQSIFLPFACMESVFVYLVETYLKSSVMQMSNNTVMSAALMLCGIKPDLLDVYHRIMAHVAMVTSDASIFLFSFIICHSLLT